MCGGFNLNSLPIVSAFGSAAGALAKLVHGSETGAKAAPAAAPAPVAGPPQATQQPDQAALRSAGTTNAAAQTAGSTLLTGGSGIAPSLLTLGKNTLLGA